MNMILNVYISSEAKALIKRYFKPCNLDEEVLNWINQLPEIFARKLGKSEDFWRKELRNPLSKFHKLNLLEGTLRFAGNKAKHWAEKMNKPFCEYLRKGFYSGSMENYLVEFIRSMLKNYYKLPN